ncbi:MAG: DUF523 domain-containing protein [Colwellia sp.]|nr:DUF523 domain-containing protein [Colwellia sp.]
MDKILVSGCFLGQLVRYNGEIKPLSHQLMALWLKQNRFISICPEVAGGLSVPRSPAEINPETSRVINSEGVDVTEAFLFGAKSALDLCHKHMIKFALLKEYSPSCGSLKIYDGSFSNTKKLGQGLTSQLLSSHGIEIFSEETIDQLAEKLDR